MAASQNPNIIHYRFYSKLSNSDRQNIGKKLMPSTVHQGSVKGRSLHLQFLFCTCCGREGSVQCEQLQLVALEAKVC